MDRSEDIADFLPIDIELSDFGEDFDPSKLDFKQGNKQKICAESAQKDGLFVQL